MVIKTNTKWFEQLYGKYKSGISNVFLITGNIGDYSVPGKLFKDYLVDELMGVNFKTIYSYNYSAQLNCLSGEYNSADGKSWDALLKLLTPAKSESKDDIANEEIARAFIIEYPEFLVPNEGMGSYFDEDTKKRLIDLHTIINSEAFIDSNNTLLFVTDSISNVNRMFIGSSSRTSIINVNYPDELERLSFIEYLEETSDKVMKKTEMDSVRFAKLTAGLSCVNIEDIFLLAEMNGSLTKEMVMERKKELIQKEFGEVIEIYDTDGASLDDFAGQEHIKAYHREVVIQPILDGDTSIVPKGLLYMGPPGTGKTYFSKCLAGDAGINFVEFKMSKILDKYVGEAERNLEKALRCFTSLAPVGVFIDEIDQALSRGENDGNSVNKNLFGMFLAYLSEPSNRGKILWIGATNYPNKMDEALKRAGRFDKKIPFLPPLDNERLAVLDIHLKKTGYEYRIDDEEYFKQKTDGYTQAEIENIVVKSLEIVKRRKGTIIDDKVLFYAMDCIMSNQNAKIKEMTDIALEECNDREFLPPDTQKRE